jgi:AraC family transcriptional regulator, transcriptional activator of pobA
MKNPKPTVWDFLYFYLMETIFRTLQQFFKSINLDISQDFEMTVHRLEGLHGDGPKKSPMFRTDYFAFLLITGGKSVYFIDGLTFDLSAGSFYFTNPGHLKSFEIEKPLKGFILTFSESFVKQHIHADFFQLFPFLLNETTPVMRLSKDKMKEIGSFWEMILLEYNGNSNYKKSILTNHLMVFLYKTKELLASHQVVIKASSKSQDLVNQFKATLNDNFKKMALGQHDKVLSIKEIENHLNVHPNYLSNVIKEETGRAATLWIQDRTIAEAKAMMKNTNKTISKIAFNLGFTDSTHFAKFFKKATDLSPTEFRKM